MPIHKQSQNIWQIVWMLLFGHHGQFHTLGIATYFTITLLILLSPWFGCDFVQGTWWALQNLMKQAKFVAYEQIVIVYIFLTLKLCFDAMALLAWWSAPEAKLITKFLQKKWTITFCSYATNFACFIKFWSAHHVHKRIWHQFIGERWRFVINNIFLL